MKQNKHSKTLTFLAFVAILVMALAAAYPFLFSSMMDKIASVGDIAVRIEDFERARGKFSRTLTFLKESADDIEKVRSVFIKESEIVSFARALEALGAQSGTDLSLESLDPSIGANKEPIINFRIKAAGTFAHVMRLEELLENFPAKLEIGSARFVRLDDSVVVPTPGGKKTPEVAGAPRWEFTATVKVLNFSKE